MITESLTENSKCLFCASDYHLEMILVPYIKENIERLRFIVLTQNSLEDSINLVLDRINIDAKMKKRIKEIGWKQKKTRDIVRENENTEKLCIIVNGDFEYINEKKRELKNFFKKNISTIDCFHIDDKASDIATLSLQYKCILNTRVI